MPEHGKPACQFRAAADAARPPDGDARTSDAHSKGAVMKIDRNDRNVLGLVILVAAVFVTTYFGWGVPLIGDSHRWATAVILVVGLAAGALSAPGLESPSYLQAGLVVAAFLFAVLAFATASIAAVAFLVLAILALVATSAARHLRHRRTPIAT
jgi:hypothetical protein